MVKINYKKLALSQLSFIILSGNYSNDEIELAKREIERRFKKTGLDYEEFIDWEKETIEKRGCDISNYLICENPSAQKLMELYFNYVSDNLMEQGNLLFSEIMLCNQDSQNTFFTDVIKKELVNIEKRLSSGNVSEEEMKTIKSAFKVLKERNNARSNWCDNSITDAVANIVVTNSSLMSVDKYKKLIDLVDGEEEKEFSIKFIPLLFSFVIYNNEFLDILNQHYIAYKDYLRLGKQRRSINKSLKNEDIDYSFIDAKKIVLKKEGEKNGI